ncbi:endonuclease domain-containing protein [Streptomyces sp. NPDC059426]|uniref:endonuclease domain-containing protein n=1 Tax=Streptomyces sp. NPDC059426 TaxID=3346827 RepID=UPI0036C3ADFB
MPEFCTGPGAEGADVPCGLPAIGGGLCNGHYQQDRRGGELVPLFTLRISQDEAYSLLEAGLKRCPACRNVKPLAEFGRSSAQLSGRSTYCIVCQPDYVLMKRFKFSSMEAVREFRESRGHRCDICKRQWQEGGNAFHIDHDSACCPSRGPSCGMCVRATCASCATRRGSPGMSLSAAASLSCRCSKTISGGMSAAGKLLCRDRSPSEADAWRA